MARYISVAKPEDLVIVSDEAVVDADRKEIVTGTEIFKVLVRGVKDSHNKSKACDCVCMCVPQFI